jgi:DNA-directed RNA polymerase specialized sigma24 family protein
MSPSDDEASEAHLSSNEAIQALRAMTIAEKTQLMKVAISYARRTHYGHEDLIQESLLRVLDGRRPWPRGLGAVPFLAGIARSITWDWKTESLEDRSSGSHPQGEERNVIARIDAIKLVSLFDDDPVAQAIIEGMLDGARGEELKELSGLKDTEYESKRVKIRRRIEKYFAPAWKL